MKEVQCPLVLAGTNTVYPYKSTDEFRDESVHMVSNQGQGSIHKRCRHLCPSPPPSIASALWWHRCELKMNLHPERSHYDTVARRGRKPRWQVQSPVGHRVCIGTRGVVLCKLCDVKIVQDAGGVYNAGGKEKGGVGGTKGYIYSNSGDFLVHLERYDIVDSYPAFCWLTNTKRPSVHHAQPLGTLWTTSLETRSSTPGEDSSRRQAFLLHHTPLWPLLPRASRSKQSSSQVVPTVQPANTATNLPSGGKYTRNWCHTIENTSLFGLRCVYLCPRGITTGKLKIYTIDGLKYFARTECNTMIIAPRRHKHPSSSANRPSDISGTVHTNAEFNLSLIRWQLTPWVDAVEGILSPSIFTGDSDVVSSGVYTWPRFLYGITPWSLKCKPTSSAIAYPCRGNDCYILNVEILYRTITSQSPHPDTTPVVRIVLKQQQCRPLGNSQPPPTKRRVSAPAGERDTSQGGSSVASTIHGQNSNLSSSLNNSGLADITQCVTSTPPTTQWRSMNIPTAMPDTSSRSTPPPGGTSQAESTHCVVFSLASGISSTTIPPSNLENLPTPIANPEACAIITNSMQTWATDRNQRQRQWQHQQNVNRFGSHNWTTQQLWTATLILPDPPRWSQMLRDYFTGAPQSSGSCGTESKNILNSV